MRIVSLEPFLTELICHFELEDSLHPHSHACNFPESILALPKVSVARASERGVAHELQDSLASGRVDLNALKALRPDVIVTRLPILDEDGAKLTELRAEIKKILPESSKLFSYQPRTLEQVYEMFARLGKDLGAERQGAQLASRIKAQSMDWCDNFYVRMKNKKVSFVSSINPLRLAGYWIPDLIQLCSAHSQVKGCIEESLETDWQTILNFRPDVIIIAPRGVELAQAASSFEDFEKLPEWESIPAVKRGEVYFTDGLRHFYNPGPRLLQSIGILVSSIAGLESGYITARDVFYRLRWLELHRHKFSAKK